MWRQVFAAATLVLGVYQGAAAQTADSRRASVAGAPLVVMLSIDGLRPEYVIHADSFGLNVPNLRRMVVQGTYADGVRGVLPTVTYPSHTTLITGASPSTHGILGNTTFDPYQRNQGGWYWYATDIRVPTLWDATRARGLRTVSVHWPVSVGAPVSFNLPQIWRAGTADDRKLVRVLATPGLLARLEQQLGPYAGGIDESIEADETRARFAAHLIAQERPALATVYLTALDHEQHVEGPLTAANVKAKRVLERLDQVVGMLTATARRVAGDSATIIVVSDHGFAPTHSEVNLSVLLREAGLLDADSTGKITSWRAAAWNAGATVAIVARDSGDLATRGAIRSLVERIRLDTALGVDLVLTRAELGRFGAYPDAEAVIVLRPGYTAASQFVGPVVRPSTVRGMHGHMPTVREMRSSFFIVGRGASPGLSLGEIDMRAIAPTVAELLGLTLNGAQSEPLRMRGRGPKTAPVRARR